MSNVLALIPARAGSKRLFGKNTKEFCGHPLVWWTMLLAKRLEDVDVLVSTDDKKIAKLAWDMDVGWSERPNELATDDAYIWDAVRYHLVQRFYETVILLQPTSPLRSINDIKACLRINYMAGDVMTVTATCNYLYRPNGVCYVVSGHDLFERRTPQYKATYVTPLERSVDIDTIEDFNHAERLMHEKNRL